MNDRIRRLFDKKKSPVLSVYCTAGFPSLGETISVIAALEKAGTDMVEIGIPFSDPIADGPTIQASNQVALRNGITLDILFRQLENIRDRVSIPLVLMGYFNPIFQFGIEAFCGACRSAGIDGVIIPDLPVEEYADHYQRCFDRFGISVIFLITPQSSETRIRKMDYYSQGFLYAVSSYGITGNTSNAFADTYLRRLEGMALRNPILVGFGVHDRASYEAACRSARGAIVGSAFLRHLQTTPNIHDACKTFITTLRGNP